jgi:hypothetical protein
MPPRLLVVSVLAVVLYGSPADAQVSAEPQDLARPPTSHAARLAANPAGLSVTARTSTGRTQFAQGELITLDLEFQDRSGGRYDFNPIAYDRSGRLGIDRIVVVPADRTDDPLQDYYRALGFGFIGGGLSTPAAPLAGPRTLSLDVNEWVRFASPGTYTLHVESNRFEDRGASAAGPRRSIAVASNQLTVTITPARNDGPAPASLPARALRFADSQASAEELARRLLAVTERTTQVNTAGHDARFGLLGTPYRAEALAALRAGLSTTARAVDEAVPQVAAFLDVMIAIPRRADVQRGDGTEAAERVRERMTLHACRLAFWQREALAAGLRGDPDEVARASVSFGNDAPAHCAPLPPVNLARLLPPVFLQLPPDQQRVMLAYRWGQVAGREMIPVLHRLVSAATDRPAAAADVHAEIRDLALVRLGELAPAEAARLSREDIVSGRFLFGARSVRVNQADRAAVTRALIAAVERARTRSSALHEGREPHARGLLPVLERFGTSPAFETLLAWPRTEPTPCAERASVIAFALRVAPERGVRLLRASLADGQSRCRESVLETLARSWPQRLPEVVAIDALWHDDRRVAAGAAGALARMGTDAARQALWRRLREWHSRWDGREADLRVATPHIDDPISQELLLERALREALLRGAGWITAADDRLRVRDLCVTAACREEFSPFRGGPPVRLLLVHAEEWTGETVYRVEGHAIPSLERAAARLARYPKTVRVAWDAGSSHSPARAKALYQGLVAAAAQRGVRVLPQRPVP